MNQGTLFDDGRGTAPEGWSPDALRPIPAGVDVVGFDTETTGLKWWDGDRPIGRSYAWREGERLVEVYYPTGHTPGGNLDPDKVREWEAAELPGKRLVGLNTRFDGHMLREDGTDLSRSTLEDAAHLVALLDDHRQVGQWGLEAIARDYLGEGKVEDHLQKDRMVTYHAEKVAAYARQDAGLVLRLHEKLTPMLEAQDLIRVRDLECQVLPVVMAMEAAGTPIDMERLEAWRKESKSRLYRLQLQLAQEAGFRVDVGSWKSMAKLWDKLGLEVTEHTPTGQPSFSDEVVKAVEAQHRALPLVRQVAKLSSLRSKFLDAYHHAVGANGIMRYGLHQLRSEFGGTISGRFSSSAPGGKGSGINVQQVFSVENQRKNLGPDYIIRELFTPATGLFLAADAAQIEYRLFAHYANSPAILRAYQEDPDADFHQVVTDMVNEAAGGTHSRKECKNVNFARLYGAGVKKVAAMLGVSIVEAKAFLAIYDRAFPQVKRLARQATDAADRRGWVKTIMGRRARFPGQERTYKALNSIIQGTAADIMKLKLVALHETAKDTGLVLRFTVHDEVCGDVPDEEAGRKVHNVLQGQALDFRVPILWETNTGGGDMPSRTVYQENRAKGLCGCGRPAQEGSASCEPCRASRARYQHKRKYDGDLYAAKVIRDLEDEGVDF
jgi:DNA polymerase-1